MSTQFEIVISGAGVVGLSLAIGLIKRGVTSIALVEPNAPPPVSHSELDDARVVALSNGSLRFLTQLLGGENIEHATPIHRIHVSDRGHLGHCVLDRREYEVDELGAVLNLHGLIRQLRNHTSLDQVHWFQPGQIVSMTPASSNVQVALGDGANLQADAVVVAEGSQSSTRDMLNVRLQHTPYEQHALVANVKMKQANMNVAYERFTEFGPMALLPLGRDMFSLVWTMSQDSMTQRLVLSDRVFLATLQREFGYRAGVFTHVGQRFHFPLNLMQPEQQVGHRWALMGNAMHTLHPIAGQGLNLGLRDVRDFLDVFDQQNARPDLGSHALLRQFELQRQADINRTVTMTDGLVKLYSNQYLPLVIGRNLGLTMMQFLPSLKTPLATQALGWWRTK